ncbi:MAG: hypothetical protein ACE5IW_02725 [bacterium]
MRDKGRIITVGVVLALGLTIIFLIASEEEPLTGRLIFTQVSADELGGEDNAPGARRYPGQNRIVALEPDGTLKVLTGGFYSARAPEVSYDGKRLLFAGQRQENDPWHIWEMTLNKLEIKQITSGLYDCTDPAYLADGQIVFSSIGADRPAQNKDGVTYALYTCFLDGSEVRRITFHPHQDFAPSVLQDGRILFRSWQMYPSGVSLLLNMRPDGTGVELFYQNRQGGRQSSRAWETSDGQVVLVETKEGDSGGRHLVAVSLMRPLHSRVVLTAGNEGNFHSVFPLSSGKLMVSYRPPGARRYALYEFDPAEGRLGRLIYSDPAYHALEPVMAVQRPRPKRLPSIVNQQKKKGWLFCLNANLLDQQDSSGINSPPKGNWVEVFGPQGELGQVVLEDDGSFYVEIPADLPVRLQTVNEEGRVVRGPSAWIWVRPNEHRGCIGCHEDREMAPENRVPLAITKPAVSLLSPTSSLAAGERSLSKGIEK